MMLITVASYFSSPALAGGSGENTCPHRLHRNPSSSYLVALTGGCPVSRIRLFGSFRGYSFPFRHSGQRSLAFRIGWRTTTRSAPQYEAAQLRPCPLFWALRRWRPDETDL